VHVLEQISPMNAPRAFSASAAPIFAPSLCATEACWVDILTPTVLLQDRQLCSDWDALAKRAATPNPFAERWYMAAALQALDSHNVRFAVVRDKGLIGLMPFAQEARYAGLPVPHVKNWLNHNAFLGTPLTRSGSERLFWQALLRHFDRQNDKALFLHLSSLAIDDPVATALEAICKDERRRYALVMREERALLERGLNREDYLEAHIRSKKRKELRRQQKRLGEVGALTFGRCESDDRLDRWISEFLDLEQRGWKGANGSALACSDDTRALFAAVLRGAAAVGKLERLDLRLDGSPIAMLANFLTPPGAFSFKTAFDEEYARFSPGVLLQIENLALLERDGIAWCDSCAAQDHPMIDSIWSGRRAIGRYSVAVGGRANRAVFAALLTVEKAKARWRKIRAAKPQRSNG
jgi:CelD/BcsL family acetyltransferase involved in cellulose biosynthesis